VLLLRLKGHDVSLAHDGPAALDAFERSMPELALLDIGLPGLDGFEVAAACERSIRNEMRARRADWLRRRPGAAYGTESGFDEHLVKPVAFDTLLGIVDSLPASSADGDA
jgi:DNA-binding response OmpR family regulator